MVRDTLVSLAAAGVLATTSTMSVAQDVDQAFGGAKGPDLSIEATEPDGAGVTLGLAGDYPADIARYLLARGAGYADLSPDGKTIAFAWTVTGEPEIWVTPSLGGQPKQITFKTGIAIPFLPISPLDDYFWTPDGENLFYSADRDGNEQTGYFTITSDGTSERSVLPAQTGDFRVFGGFKGEKEFVYASTARGAGVFDLYRGTLNGESELLLEAELGLFPRSVSPDGRYAIVTEAVGEDADNLYLVDLSSRARVAISEPPLENRASHLFGGFEWAPDSSMFYFSTNLGREFAALSRYEVDRQRLETEIATNADIENIELCGRDGELIVYTENHDGFDQLFIRNIKDGSQAPVPNLPEGNYQLDCEGDDEPMLLVRVSGWRTPGDLWMIDPLQGTSRKVLSANLAGLDPKRLVRPQTVRYEARDGVELQGLLYLPKGAARGDKAPPIVFSVHGGPTLQSQATFRAVTQYLVNRGIAVFEPNIRGSIGLGRTYVTLDDREKRLDSIRDLVDLLDALGDDGLVDRDRAAVAGGSYGGYVVNAVLAEYPGVFKAGVAAYGVADWVTALEVASPILKASDRIEYGDINEDRWRAFYEINSPIRQADRIRVPVLFSHGVMDPRIDISETETMVKALRANGVDAPFLRIPDEGHGLRKLSNQLFYYRRMAEFIEKHLGLATAEKQSHKASRQ